MPCLSSSQPTQLVTTSQSITKGTANKTTQVQEIDFVGMKRKGNGKKKKKRTEQISADSPLFPNPLMHVAWGKADRMEVNNHF